MPLRPPEFINGIELGTILSGEKHYMPLTAYDPDPLAGPIIYSTNSSLPGNLQLDPTTGYLYGYLSTQTEYLKHYTITVKATKHQRITNAQVTATNTFTLTVLGRNQNKISWVTPANLGNIEEGITSELSVVATQTSVTSNLKYKLVPDNSLPRGLSLSTSTGDIIGYATTSGNFSFTVLASTATYGDSIITATTAMYAFATQTFNLNIIPVSTEYTSIYVKPFLTPSQNQEWTNFITSSSIFLPELLYRADDPAFGVQTELKMFLEFGIERLNIAEYVPALAQHFYMRRLGFGSVKTAIAKDSNGNHVYDAVYVDIIDDLEGAKSAVSINGNVYYPGSINNMRNALESLTLGDGSTIKIDPKHLPRFMQTVQSGSQNNNAYIKAVILCYTLPGQATKITNRIRASKFNFQDINFIIDRLVVQNSLDQDGATYLVFNKRSIN